MIADDSISTKSLCAEEVKNINNNEEEELNNDKIHNSSVSTIDIDTDEMILSILSSEGSSIENTAIQNKKSLYLSISRLNCNDGSSSDEDKAFNNNSANDLDLDDRKIEPEDLEDETESFNNNYSSLINCDDCEEEFGDFSDSFVNSAVHPQSDFDASNDSEEQFADFESSEAAVAIAINAPPANVAGFVSIPPLSEGSHL